MSEDALHAVEAERAVLGSAMLDSSAADACLPILHPESFVRLAHERIWGTIVRLRAKGTGCDVLEVGDDLKAHGHLDAVEGYSYLSDLTASVAAVASAPAYARMVHAAFLRRKVIRVAQEAIAAAKDPEQDTATLAALVDRGLRSVADAAAATDEPKRLSDLVTPAFAFVEDLYEGKVEPGIGTGIPLLDCNLNGGLHAGDLMILGAQPSAGKSAFAEAMALHIAARAHTVLYATPEMTGMTVALRALAHRAGIDMRKLWGVPRLDGEDWPRLSCAMGVVGEQGRTFWIEDKATTWDAIAAHARRLHAKEPLTLLVVDHLHELEWPAGCKDENKAITEIVVGCKRIAKTLNIAVLLLSQLNRAARQEKRPPRAHDLRGSGAIEQHADAILLLHPKDDENAPREVSVDVIIEKQRNGKTGPLTLYHDRATGRFRDPRESCEGPRAGDAS